MSRKTVLFKMPAKAARRPDQPDLPPVGEVSAPIPLRARRDATPALASASDLWVQRRDEVEPMETASPLRLATTPYEPVAAVSFTIDLAAERSLEEVITLSFLVPPMLGWCWLFYAMNKYLPRFA
jgi:hypothetical protein